MFIVLSLFLSGLIAIDVHSMFHKLAPLGSVCRHSVQCVSILIASVHQVYHLCVHMFHTYVFNQPPGLTQPGHPFMSVSTIKS